MLTRSFNTNTPNTNVDYFGMDSRIVQHILNYKYINKHHYSKRMFKYLDCQQSAVQATGQPLAEAL